MKRTLLVLWALLPASLISAQPSSVQPPPTQTPPAKTVAELPSLTAEPFALPDGEGGIGLDDLAFIPSLHRVVVPAGRTGRLDLIDPETRKVTEIRGFQASAAAAGGHGAGPTSVDAGKGFLFAIDRTVLRLSVVDPRKRTVGASAPLAGGPDYVRFVAATNEIWVTEPDKDGIEIFALSAGGRPVPSHKEFLSIPGGPESLVVDAATHRAYANLWKSSTLVIDLASRKVVATWPNGCEGSRGLALDAARRLLFVGCAEGGASALDLASGAVRDHIGIGSGVDIVAYNPALHHLYVPAAKLGQMAIVAVSDAGKLSLIGTVPTAQGAHCAVADDRNQVWICDPKAGRLLVVRDTLKPASSTPGG